MTQSLTPLQKDTATAAETADRLAKALGGTASHWSIWLANDRKPGRVNRCLPQEPVPGRPQYNTGMIDAYIAGYKKNHSATGHTPSSSRGQRLAPHISVMTLADGADQSAVLFVIPKPLTSFMLSAQEARQLAARLTKAADEIDAEVTK